MGNLSRRRYGGGGFKSPNPSPERPCSSELPVGQSWGRPGARPPAGSTSSTELAARRTPRGDLDLWLCVGARLVQDLDRARLPPQQLVRMVEATCLRVRMSTILHLGVIIPISAPSGGVPARAQNCRRRPKFGRRWGGFVVGFNQVWTGWSNLGLASAEFWVASARSAPGPNWGYLGLAGGDKAGATSVKFVVASMESGRSQTNLRPCRNLAGSTESAVGSVKSGATSVNPIGFHQIRAIGLTKSVAASADLGQERVRAGFDHTRCVF